MPLLDGFADLAKLIAVVLVIGALFALRSCFVTPAHAQTGVASWYDYTRHRTACGGKVGPMTAAHRRLPCGTRVRVTTAYGAAVLTINDRGPFVHGRIIDVSPDAARVLGLIRRGRARATAEVVR